MPGPSQLSFRSWVKNTRLGFTGQICYQRYQGWICVEVLKERIVEVSDNRSRVVSEAVWERIRIDVNAVLYHQVVVRALW